MSYQDALTTAREALLDARKQLDGLIAALDGLLGVPARQILPPLPSRRGARSTARKARSVNRKADPVNRNAGEVKRRGKLAGKEEQVRVAVLSGEPLGVIAKRMGVHFTSIGKLAKKHGWKAGRAKPAEAVPIRKLARGVSGRPE